MIRRLCIITVCGVIAATLSGCALFIPEGQMSMSVSESR